MAMWHHGRNDGWERKEWVQRGNLIDFFRFICGMFDLVCCMYVEEICPWSSILEPLAKGLFWLFSCAVK
jgi:hypothetical protein